MGPLALLVAGGFFAAGQIQEGRIAEAQGKFAKDVAIRNQEALDRQAQAEKDAARIDEKRTSRKQKIVMAAQRAVIGKSGIGLAGATLSVLADTAAQFSLDRNLILRRGLLRSRELKTRGQIVLAQGRFARSLGLQAKRLSYVKAGGSILAGASGFGGGSSSGVGGFSTGPTGGVQGPSIPR